MSEPSWKQDPLASSAALGRELTDKYRKMLVEAPISTKTGPRQTQISASSVTSPGSMYGTQIQQSTLAKQSALQYSRVPTTGFMSTQYGTGSSLPMSSTVGNSGVTNSMNLAGTSATTTATTVTATAGMNGTALGSTIPTDPMLTMQQTMSMASTQGLSDQRLYTSDFINSLQQRHKEALQRQLETSEKLIGERDATNRQLKVRIRELEDKLIETQRQMNLELKNVKRETSNITNEVTKAREEEAAAAQAIISNLKDSHRNKINALKEQYDASLEQLRNWAKEEVIKNQTEHEKETKHLMEELENVKKQSTETNETVQSELAQKFEALQANYISECERASLLEQEIVDLKADYRQEKLLTETKLRDAVAESESYRKQNEALMKRIDSQGEQFTVQLTGRVQQCSQMHTAEKTALENRIKDLETQLTSLEALRKQQLTGAIEDLGILNNELTEMKNALSRTQSENKRLSKDFSDLKMSKDMGDEELNSLRAEVSKLRQENEGLKAEIDRLDEILNSRRM